MWTYTMSIYQEKIYSVAVYVNKKKKKKKQNCEQNIRKMSYA